MSDFINQLKKLEMSEDSFVTLSFTEGNDVWHINDGYVADSVAETATASMLAGLLASGVPVYSTYGEPSEGGDILNEMRANNELDDYERGDEAFTDFVSEVIESEHWNFGWIEHSTEKHDHKRGFTSLSAEFDIPLADLKNDPMPLIGWKASVQTPNGYLTVDR